MMTRTWHLYRAEFHCALMQQLRVPLEFASTTFFNILAYLAWVLVFHSVALPFDVDSVLIFTFTFFVLLNTFNLGLVRMGLLTADERSAGWMRLRRASPMRPWLYFGAKLGVTMLQAMLFALVLSAVTFLFGPGQITPGQAVTLFLTLTLGVLPFCAMGVALAYLGGPKTAQVVIAYASMLLAALAIVLFIDLDLGVLSIVLQVVNQLFPVYHFAVLTFGFTGLSALQGGPAWLHALALVGLTALFTTLAIYLYRRDEGKTYG
jgi:ABC-2 type transport system permease protein